MPKRKTSIKGLPESETGNNGMNPNKCVFTVFCKNIVDELKKEVPNKPATLKQMVIYSLLSMDESSKREVVEMIRNNKRFDRVVDNFIRENRRIIVDFFSQQRDLQGNVAVLRQRIAELEAQVGVQDAAEYV